MLDDLTLVLQGRLTEECFDLWLANYSEFNVVLSVWVDCVIDFNKIELPKKWRVVKTSYPYTRLTESNLDYQLITTLSGLSEVRTEWVIKARLDEYWSNLERVYDKMKLNCEKIVCGSMFFRPLNYQYPWHISDKVIGGTAENMKLMFENTYHNIEIKLWEYPIPESQLGFGYVFSKEKELQMIPNISKLLKKVDQHRPDDEVRGMVAKAVDTVIKDMTKIMVDGFYTDNGTDWEGIADIMEHSKHILNNSVNYVETKFIQYIDYIPYMAKWFDIIDVNELKPYIATQNFNVNGDAGRIWYRDNFDNFQCITHF